MADYRGPIAPENLSTVAAVAAIVALLALAYGLFLNRQLHEVAVSAASLDVKAARHAVEMQHEIDALTTRVAALETASSGPAVATGAAPGAAPGAAATAGASAGVAAP